MLEVTQKESGNVRPGTRNQYWFAPSGEGRNSPRDGIDPRKEESLPEMADLVKIQGLRETAVIP